MLLSHILTKKNYKTPVQETFDFGSYKLQDHRSYIKLVRKTPVLSARHYGIYKKKYFIHSIHDKTKRKFEVSCEINV